MYLFKLIHKFAHWISGSGIAADENFIEWRADHALCFCSMLWVNLQFFAGYVLHETIDEDLLRGRRKAKRSHQEVVTHMNAVLTESIFPTATTEDPLKKQAGCPLRSHHG
ncbi:hypothetical protein [Blastomonas sp.]|uniref:hypothetical protein n=1 Tax=Blastomonas sp. TaxID=1909299 RepID=UPI001859055A|nr:hypothetical protein [Blastomonas sp.]